MVLRLQSLNAVKAFRRGAFGSTLSFSTSSKACEGGSITSSLSSIGDTPSNPVRFIQPKPYNPSQRLSNTRSSRTPAGNSRSNAAILNLTAQASARRQRAQAAQPQAVRGEDIRKHALKKNLTAQIKRRWKVGDVYAPHDLSAVEMMKWKSRGKPEHDAFKLLDLNPVHEYKNFSIMSEFMTTMGRIMGRQETGLRPVNQRRIAKAIRRSIGLGLMPSVHRHPEILQAMAQKQAGGQGRGSRF